MAKFKIFQLKNLFQNFCEFEIITEITRKMALNKSIFFSKGEKKKIIKLN